MPSSALLCGLVFLARVGASRDQGTLSENSCTHFPAILPSMPWRVRGASWFRKVKTFFGRRPGNNRSRDWSDASISQERQGLLETTRSQNRDMNRFSLRAPRRNQPH